MEFSCICPEFILKSITSTEYNRVIKMVKVYEITEEILNKIRIIRKIIKNKNENTRLYEVVSK